MGIIAISRGSYTKGKTIAEKLAQRVGYQCISREVLLKASEDFSSVASGDGNSMVSMFQIRLHCRTGRRLHRGRGPHFLHRSGLRSRLGRFLYSSPMPRVFLRTLDIL